MKKLHFVPLIAICIASFIFLSGRFTSTPTENQPTIKGDGPANPGWYKQWHTMRANEDGVVPEDYMRNVRAQEMGMAKTSGGGNISNVQEIGPDNVGGRTRALIIDILNPDHMIAGGISGGIWRSTDRGQSWFAVDDFNSTLSVTSLAQDLNQPLDMYYTTGEVRGNSAGISGDGVFKSTDGGQSFSKLASTNSSIFNTTWRVAVSPINPGEVYVATRNGGLQRSQDAGASFAQVFSIAGGNEISDVEVFQDSSVMIGVRTKGVYYSPSGDAGSFVKLTSNLPSNFRRVELAYCDSFPENIYSTFEATNGTEVLGVWKSTDGGTTWNATSADPENTINFSFPWYCLLLSVAPDNPNFVIAAGAQMAYTSDGGNSWTDGGSSHADYHIATYDRGNPNLVYIGNDGGIYRYSVPFMNSNGLDLNNGYNVTQFYTGAYFPQNDFMAGTQDNGTQASRSGNTSFQHIVGGDGSYCAVNQQDPNISYASTQNGNIRRAMNSQNAFPSYSNVKGAMDANNDGDIDDGAWFINPFDINLQDGSQLFFVTRARLWRTNDDAQTWTPVTNYLNWGGVRTFTCGISNEVNPTVYVAGESASFYRVSNARTAVPGDEVNLSTTVPSGVTSHFISSVVVHPDNPGTVYVTFTTVSSQSRIYRVTDAETNSPTWTAIGSGLPSQLPVNWIALHPHKPDSFLMAATDFGLYTTVDAGGTWTKETSIPNVSIHMLRLRPNDRKLFIFTHGRGAWTGDLPYLADAKTAIAEGITSYPQPANTRIRLNSKIHEVNGAQYQLMAAGGKQVRAGQWSAAGLESSELPEGIYFLKLKGEFGNWIGKVMVLH